MSTHIATANFELPPAAPQPDRTAPALRWSVRTFVATVWISAALFAAYILAGYVGAAVTGHAGDWNDLFPRLYARRSLAANIGMGLHFALGAVLLLLGPIQLFTSIRTRWPRVHRWTGWVYASAAVVTGLGGTVYILGKGTIGGTAMDVAFAIYGLLMVVAAAQTVRFAVARRLEIHRAWAIRLFALAIGSWLYRMDYGFWMLFAGRTGRTPQFDGPFDLFMLYWFFVPNLIVAEMFIRARRTTASATAQFAAAGVLSIATIFVALGTFFFTWKAWAPVVLARIAGL
ncbi:DUF2306 domain-containing protein [Sphingosinithalassobacter portus]|uniref:DUF2306 domain-containing protein n=1 Tax=Stakelama portus TaxID=2676234 RepID=UPI000D6E4D12|nr:DUF2306 domain-containing protein [Sphingosinithalassobacter portus]